MTTNTILKTNFNSRVGNFSKVRKNLVVANSSRREPVLKYLWDIFCFDGLHFVRKNTVSRCVPVNSGNRKA